MMMSDETPAPDLPTPPPDPDPTGASGPPSPEAVVDGSPVGEALGALFSVLQQGAAAVVPGVALRG